MEPNQEGALRSVNPRARQQQLGLPAVKPNRDGPSIARLIIVINRPAAFACHLDSRFMALRA